MEWINDIYVNVSKIKNSYLYGEHEKYTVMIQDGFTVFLNRDSVVNILPEVLRRANKGDLVFGQNRSGINYPKELYDELEKAALRGVEIKVIMPFASGTTPLSKFLIKIKNNIEVRLSREEYVRIFGIKGKEIVIAFPMSNSFYGIHLTDEQISNHFFKLFHDTWQKARRI